MNESRLAGIGCIVAAVALFSLQDAVIKWLSGDYPLHEIVLVRAGIGVVTMLAAVHLEGGLWMLGTPRVGWHVGRGLLIAVANSSYFLAVASMPLADAMAVFFVAPLVITALSALLLGERVGPRRWSAVLVGLAGVVVMLRPGGEAFRAAALLPLLAATAYACMQMITRRVGLAEKASVMAFYAQLTLAGVSATVGLVAGDGGFDRSADPSLSFLLRAWVAPGAGDAALFVVVGALNAGGGYLMTQAYRISEATAVAPFEYAAMPLAMLWGLLLFGHRPDGQGLAGIALIVGSGLYVFFRERALARRDARTP